MKKLKDKTIIVICSICMALICCFGFSYKMANKTYASDLTPITDKQRLGAFLSSLAFSCGVRVYISAVSTYEWLVDNFNYVMLRLQFAISANDVYQNALDNFDDENKTYTLDPEFTKAVQEYLKYLQSEGLNEYSGTVEIGEYEEEVEGSYFETHDNTYGILGRGDYNYFYTTKTSPTNNDIRIVGVKKGSKIYTIAVSKNTFKMFKGTGTDDGHSFNASQYAYKVTENGIDYYVYSANPTNLSYTYNIDVYDVINNKEVNTGIYYTYGDGSIDGGTEIIPVNGKPNPYWSETQVTLDRDAEYTVDYSETDGAEETSTLDELIELINELIETGTSEQQETIPQVDVQIFTPTIDPTTIDIPTLFDGIPEIITPDCVGLGSCMVSGVQSVSQHLQDIYNSNSSVANYTLVSLAIGVALYILTGGI